MAVLYLADLVLTIHMLFILFVVLGALLVLKWHLLIWIHIPCVIWAAILELRGWICPLTYLENYLRKLGNSDEYIGDFIQHYLTPVIYPTALTTEIQVYLGISVLIINIITYGFVVRHWSST